MSAPEVHDRDNSLMTDDRVEALIEAMTLREKVAQLYGMWVGADPDGPGVAPHQTELENGHDFPTMIRHGLGQLTRAFGTNPVDAAEGAAALARAQASIVDAGRFGIPALVHEECLAGFTTLGATAYPVPLSWGATFNPELIREMAGRIGASMRSVGVHQGLAPVLDVVRDPRWGRVEETIGEDPYLIGRIATAYVQGLQQTGIVATLKHFAGYSASRAGRNLAPVSMGAREFADVVLPPFEMAVVEGGVRSVMHSYSAVDGIPSAADRRLLTTLLRDTWGFDGTVVADYFGIGFLKLLHGTAETFGDAARQALSAGVDVELPGPKAYLDPLINEVNEGRVELELVDRALRRVLLQKGALGLLDPDWDPTPPALRGRDSQASELRGLVDLDVPADRLLARRIAHQAIILLSNNGVLPLQQPGSIAVIGPGADDPITLLGCYSFPAHVGVHHPELDLGIAIPTILDAITTEYSGSTVSYESGCDIREPGQGGFDNALRLARAADVVILALGDRSGLFGRGTSGEGCDAETLQLPGEQAALLEAILDVSSSVVLVVNSGRPYALGTAPDRAAAIIQTFFPGEEGGRAIADVIAGHVNPSGRLPVSIPASPFGQPWTYLTPQLAQRSEVSALDPTPRYPFGFGGGYSTFDWLDASVDGPEMATDGRIGLEITIRNTSPHDGTEITQLYLHDPVASVTRPVTKLISFERVDIAAGKAVRVRFEVPADLTSFIGGELTRIVEPGCIELRIGSSSADTHFTATVSITGPVRSVDHHRELHCVTTATKLD